MMLNGDNNPSQELPSNSWTDTIASWWKPLAGLGVFFTGVAAAWYLSESSTSEIAINGLSSDGATFDMTLPPPIVFSDDKTPEVNTDFSHQPKPTTHVATQRRLLNSEIGPVPLENSFDTQSFFPNETKTVQYDGSALFRAADGGFITWQLYDKNTGVQPDWLKVEDKLTVQPNNATTWQVTLGPAPSNYTGNYQIVVEAMSESGDTASDILPVRIEGKPVFIEPLPNHQITVGEVWNYFIPQGVVKDPNKDALTYRAQLVGGGSLPAGLNFDSRSATFSGLLDNSGVYEIEVIVNDNIAGASSTTFTLTATNKPEINIPILDPSPGRENKLFNFVIPKNAFINPDGSSLVYEAAQENGLPIPDWLRFDKDTLVFSGTPPEDSATEWLIKVSAVNPISGSSASQIFTLRVDPNFAPQLTNAIPQQYATVGERYELMTPNTFTDPNHDNLTYSATTINGKGLPKGLRFFSDSKTFYWKPGRDAVGNYEPGIYGIRLAASDGEKSAYTDFVLIVNGMGSMELSFKIVFPSISIIIFLIGLYLGRAYCLNRINPEGYQQLGLQFEVGEVGTAIDLGFSKDEIGSVSFVSAAEKSTGRCGPCLNFFGARHRSYPTGELPRWLVYHLATNKLEIVAPGPSEDDVRDDWFLLVKDYAGNILNEIPVRIANTNVPAHGYESPTPQMVG